MREILFRAKRVDNGEWVEGYLFDDGMAEVEHYFVGRIVVEPYKGTACDDWNITGIDFCEVNPETLCQYTGLKDKNGKRIWENDIVKYTDEITNKICLDLIKYDKKQASFVRVHTSAMGEQYLSMHKISSGKQEVIGNIFDNPELLGQDGEKNA